MKTRTGLLVTTAVGALAIGLSCGNQALAADVLLKAPPPAEVGWWSSVYVEVGGRFFVDRHGGGTGGNFANPPGAPNKPTTHLSAGPYPSLGKFYEYRDLRPGPFGELFAAGGTTDGLYQWGLGAKNIGYRDQSYWLDWSQAGVQYLTLGFDQLPHTYNDNATTIFQGAGSNNLTVPLSLRTALSTALGAPNTSNGNNTVTASGNGTTIANLIEGNLNSFRLGFDRYNGAGEYRWTPSDSWDVRVDYNVTARDGTQPQSALTYNGAERGGRIVLELPKPVHDQTHNANVNVEYNGVTPWGNKFNANFGYGLSIYHDDADSFAFQNPFVITDSPGCVGGALPCGAGSFMPLNNVMSLPPSNVAHMLRFNGGMDLPMNSRWVAAVNYNWGRQDRPFLPFTASGNLLGVSGVPANLISTGFPTLTGGGPGFNSNSLLVNNVLTTKWTHELSQTTRYRFYDYDASHDPIALSFLLLADSANSPDVDDTFISHGVAYTKQNAGTEFVWRPDFAVTRAPVAGMPVKAKPMQYSTHWLTLGAGVGWEQWDRRWRGQDPGDPDVRVTNEFTGKAFLTAKPWDWSQLRTSYLHATRRYDGTYEQNIGGNDECNCPGFRSYDLANRDRDKLTVMLDLYAPNGLVITPNAGFRFDDYSGWIPQNSTAGGLLHDNAWNVGVEANWVINPFVTLIGSYMHERGGKDIWIPPSTFDAFVNDTIDTFMGGANLVLVPDKLDLKLAYTMMYARGAMKGSPTSATAIFPDQTQKLDRLDVQAKYKVDPTYMQQLGFKGETYVKLRYLWEHNEVSDWAAVNWNYMLLFNGDTSQNKNIALGWNNPNYNVQLLMASVGFKW